MAGPHAPRSECTARLRLEPPSSACRYQCFDAYLRFSCSPSVPIAVSVTLVQRRSAATKRRDGAQRQRHHWSRLSRRGTGESGSLSWNSPKLDCFETIMVSSWSVGRCLALTSPRLLASRFPMSSSGELSRRLKAFASPCRPFPWPPHCFAADCVAHYLPLRRPPHRKSR